MQILSECAHPPRDVAVECGSKRYSTDRAILPIDRTHQYFDEINATPVVVRWKYKMDEVPMIWTVRALIS